MSSDKNKHPVSIGLDNVNYRKNIFINISETNLFEVTFLGFSSFIHSLNVDVNKKVKSAIGKVWLYDIKKIK
jgi:hypothetical protein